MLRLLKKKLQAAPVPRAASVGAERRVYAIGDIHGRADLFDDLLARIDRDDRMRGAKPGELILLGDLIDRGHQSAQVVARALEIKESGAPIRMLKGNHEEVFIMAARGDMKATRFFCRIGGHETILSYGLAQSDYAAMDFEEMTDWLLNTIPRSHIDFLDGFEDMIEIGDYLFVHAGIRPNVPLEQQTRTDLRWIREEFLSSRADLGKLVVHGHTITEDVDEQVNRIGIDTGAYHSGKLTAIGLEGADRWYISTLND